MGSQAKICRFCLKNCYKTFTAVDEITMEMLDILLLKMNLLISDEPVMCSDCEEKIKTFFLFKSTCLYTEDYLVSFVNDKDDEKVNLKDVYLSNRKHEDTTDIVEDCTICRFCMDLLKSWSFISLDEENKTVVLEKVMCEKCLPEMDINATKKPVICSLCHRHLRNYYNFLINCFQVEETIKKYCKSGLNRQGLIKLKDILQFSTKNLCENDDTIGVISDIEDKPNEEEGSEVEIKLEDSLKIEVEELRTEQEKQTFVETESRRSLSCEEDEIKIDHHDLNSFCDIILPEREVGTKLFKSERCLSTIANRSSSNKSVHSNSSETKKFKCDCCPFQTKSKKCLKKHMLVHEDASEVTMFKCDCCPFQAKRKGSLKRHMLIHKDTSEVTMFK